MGDLSKNKVGMTVGIYVAVWHALWSLLVGVGVAQEMLDWVLPLHFVGLAVPITAFSWINALILTIAAFIGGYLMGWLFAALWNCKCGKKRR